MARFNIDILGAPELSKALAALPDNLERKVLTKAVREAARYFLTLAQARAPKESGRLASTMKAKALKRSRRRVGYLVQTGTRAELGIAAAHTRVSFRGGRVVRGKTVDSYYPAHIEFGHRDRSGNHQPPNPYMRSSLRSGRAAMLAILRQEIDTGIERELTKGKL